MLTYASNSPNTVVNPTVGPMNGTGRIQDQFGAGQMFGTAYGPTATPGLFPTPFMQPPGFGYPQNVTPYSPVRNFTPVPQPFGGAFPTPFVNPTIPFAGVPSFFPGVTPSPFVAPTGSPFGATPYQPFGGLPMAYNGFAGIQSTTTPFCHPLAAIHASTPFVNPILGNVPNPFANISPFASVSPFANVSPFAPVNPFVAPHVNPFISTPANSLGAGFSGVSPFGITPNPMIGNVPFTTPFTTPFGAVTTPFGIPSIPGLTPWNVSGALPGINPLIANSLPFANSVPFGSTVPFGISPWMNALNPTAPFGGNSPFVNNIATQSMLPWLSSIGCQSPLIGGNPATPWLSGMNSINPFNGQIPSWLNPGVVPGIGATPFGANINPWISSNIFSSPISSWLGGCTTPGASCFGGISPVLPMSGSFAQPIGFGPGNCVSPLGCCI